MNQFKELDSFKQKRLKDIKHIQERRKLRKNLNRKAKRQFMERQRQFKESLELSIKRREDYDNYQKRFLHNVRNKIAPDSVKLDADGWRIL